MNVDVKSKNYMLSLILTRLWLLLVRETRSSAVPERPLCVIE